jgi:hypothetical protein
MRRTPQITIAAALGILIALEEVHEAKLSKKP